MTGSFAGRARAYGIASALMLLVRLVLASLAVASGAEIDGARSRITVRVYKTGLFSVLAHNHEISAPIESGEVEQSGSPSVELRVDAHKLRVLDPDASDDTRAQIQRTMEGPEVLDPDHFPEIHFRSTNIEAAGADHWVVHGNLDLHGQTRPVALELVLKDGLYRGSATLKQTAFGITPVSIAGGTVKVKDEVKVEFEIALVK